MRKRNGAIQITIISNMYSLGQIRRLLLLRGRASALSDPNLVEEVLAALTDAVRVLGVRDEALPQRSFHGPADLVHGADDLGIAGRVAAASGGLPALVVTLRRVEGTVGKIGTATRHPLRLAPSGLRLSQIPGPGPREPLPRPALLGVHRGTLHAPAGLGDRSAGAAERKTPGGPGRAEVGPGGDEGQLQDLGDNGRRDEVGEAEGGSRRGGRDRGCGEQHISMPFHSRRAARRLGEGSVSVDVHVDVVLALLEEVARLALAV
jgi:hypothetical protein